MLKNTLWYMTNFENIFDKKFSVIFGWTDFRRQFKQRIGIVVENFSIILLS